MQVEKMHGSIVITLPDYEAQTFVKNHIGTEGGDAESVVIGEVARACGLAQEFFVEHLGYQEVPAKDEVGNNSSVRIY